MRHNSTARKAIPLGSREGASQRVPAARSADGRGAVRVPRPDVPAGAVLAVALHLASGHVPGILVWPTTPLCQLVSSMLLCGKTLARHGAASALTRILSASLALRAKTPTPSRIPTPVASLDPSNAARPQDAQTRVTPQRGLRLHRELYMDLERQRLAELSRKQQAARRRRWQVRSADSSGDPAKAQPLSSLHGLLTVTVFGHNRSAHVS